MEKGDIVKFKEGGPYDRYSEENVYYRILIINSSGAKCVNKGIAMRPIKNNSTELFYRSGDLMNIREEYLELANVVMKPKTFL